MSDPFETEFEFEELSIALFGKAFKGMLLNGIATLAGDEDGFYVVHVALDDGPTLLRRGNGWMGFPAAFEDEFFKRIADVIENPRTDIGALAETTWRVHVDELTSPESIAAYEADTKRSLHNA